MEKLMTFSQIRGQNARKYIFIKETSVLYNTVNQNLCLRI